MGRRRRASYDADAFNASGGLELHDALTAKMEQMRVLGFEMLEIVGEMDTASIAHVAGHSSLEAFLMTTQRVSRVHARQLVSLATQIQETVTPTGHRQPAALPEVRDALAAGAIGADHADVIVKAVAEIHTPLVPRCVS